MNPLDEQPDAEIEPIKQVLEHLHHPAFLKNHPLTRRYVNTPVVRPGEQLRRQMIEAIEALNPGESVSFRFPLARPYRLLHLHYLEGMTLQQAAHELGISERQSYRDLRQGLESVAAIFNQISTPGISTQAIETDLDRFKFSLAPVDFGLLLQNAQQAVHRLAEQQQIEIICEAAEGLLFTDQVLAQQFMTHLLSSTIQHARTSILSIELHMHDSTYELQIGYLPRTAESLITRPVFQQLLARLSWAAIEETDAKQHRLIKVTIKIHAATILIIDDNEGLIALIERYLTGYGCRVLGAVNGLLGLALATEARPNLIILDVMMPGLDGWEILQRLRANPVTQTIPVMVCSVFNDPELAFSLGAAHFLPKPCTQADLIRALQTIGII